MVTSLFLPSDLKDAAVHCRGPTAEILGSDVKEGGQVMGVCILLLENKVINAGEQPPCLINVCSSLLLV